MEMIFASSQKMYLIFYMIGKAQKMDLEDKYTFCEIKDAQKQERDFL